jgi:SAM-dependent methyltransferase
MFLDLVSAEGIEEIEAIEHVALKSVASLNKGDGALSGELERRWYASLERARPDYGVYGESIYFAEAWACWAVYSRRYLKVIRDVKPLPPAGIAGSLEDIRRVADLGCGVGLTTAALTEVFPGAEVIGTNLIDSYQARIAMRLGGEFKFKMEERVTSPVDLLFASEYFEHFPRPVDHLRDLLEQTQPRALLIANTFNQSAIGHFPTYEDGLSGPETSKLFNKTLRLSGYRHIPTGAWNNRPALWMRDESYTLPLFSEPE